MLATFVEAINNKQALRLIYSDKVRIVNPCAVGYTPKYNVVARVWQTGDEPGFKLFSLDKVDGHPVPVGTFEDIPVGYKLNDAQMTHVIAQLSLGSS